MILRRLISLLSLISTVEIKYKYKNEASLESCPSHFAHKPYTSEGNKKFMKMSVLCVSFHLQA